MKFESHTFSKRFPPITCALFVIHEPPRGPYVEYDTRGEAPPSHAEIAFRGTAAAIILPDGRFWVGVCLCSPRDQFIKAVGRQKAIGRAHANARRNQVGYSLIAITENAATLEAEIARLKACLQVEINEAKRRATAL